MNDQTPPWEPGQRPLAMPSEDSRGPSYDAAVERAQAAFNAARAALADRPILDNVGDLAALAAKLPPEIAIVLDDEVRTDRDAPAAGKDIVYAVVAEMATVTMAPQTPVRDQHGQEHDVLEPALQLGTRVLASAKAPAPADTRAYRLHDRAEEALEDGEIGAYLTLVARQLEQVAKHLDTTIPGWFPRGLHAPELMIDADRLRALAVSLAGQATAVEALINDDGDDLDEG